MYTTRPLSLYKNSPEAISYPPEGPNSSYLVLQDEESTETYCFGFCKNPAINNLPFPQNKLLSVEYTTQTNSDALVSSSHTTYDRVYLIPVINKPLSSNQYYMIKADGKHIGEAYASSKEQDKGTCCFCIPYIRDVKPRSFDPDDIYQQYEFSVTPTCMNSHMLAAKSLASDGHPPNFLRRHGWRMNAKTPKNFTLEEARGLDSSLRAHLPDFSFSVTQQRSRSVIVGKWYCPSIFIKEGAEKDQIKDSPFYELTLEQRWERIFDTENTYAQEKKTVTIDTSVQTEVIIINGQQSARVEVNDDKGVVLFRSSNDGGIGLSKLIVERMIWEQEKAGWVKGKENNQVKVIKDENYEGVMMGWRSFGLYMLVESFVLKRNDGSVVMIYEFNHTHQLRSKWE